MISNGGIDIEELDEISLENLEVRCVVGIYPREKIEPQPLIVNLKLYLDTRQSVATNSLEHSIDYAELSDEVRFILQNSHFRLLETAAAALTHYLLAAPAPDRPRAQIQAVSVKLAKPKALPGSAVPSLSINRHLTKMSQVDIKTTADGVELIHENQDCLIYRLHFGKQSHCPAFSRNKSETVEMPLSSGLVRAGKPLAMGVGQYWRGDHGEAYFNPTEQKKTLLCVSRTGSK